MQTSFRWAGLLVLAIFVFPASGADDKKEQLVAAGNITGKVLNVQGASGALTIQVTLKIPTPNVSAQNRIAVLTAVIAQESAKGAKANRSSLTAWQVELQQQQAKAITFQDKKQDYRFETIEDVRVRIVEPPAEFDDQGKRKKLTSAQLKELKGPGNLWGYPAKFEQVQKDMIVQLVLARKKDAKASAKKEKDADPTEGVLVTTIHILDDDVKK